MGQDCTFKRDSGQECVPKESFLRIPTKKGEVMTGRHPQLLTQTSLCWFYDWFVLLSWFPLEGGWFRRKSSNFFVYKDVSFCLSRSALVMKANVSWLVKLSLFSQWSLGSETTPVLIFYLSLLWALSRFISPGLSILPSPIFHRFPTALGIYPYRVLKRKHMLCSRPSFQIFRQQIFKHELKYISKQKNFPLLSCLSTGFNVIANVTRLVNF